MSLPIPYFQLFILLACIHGYAQQNPISLPINSKDEHLDTYQPFYFSQKNKFYLLFTAFRKNENGCGTEDIWIVKTDKKAIPIEKSKMLVGVSEMDKVEGCPFVSYKDKKIYYVATLDTSEYKNKKIPPIQIYERKMKNFTFDSLSFSKRRLLKGIIVNEQWQSMPFIFRNGKEMLFCVPTDSSKMDIWYAYRKNIHQEWSNPQPLKSINTKFNESYPILSKNGKYLYFSSDRPNPNGFGGYDIYRVKKTTKWQVL